MEKKKQVKQQTIRQPSKPIDFKIKVYSKDGKVVGSKILPEDIFGEKPNNLLLQQALRVYLDNKHSRTASTKTRSEVSGGGRKPWRQKGTGRARAGTIRAPHWRGGGVVFGPKPPVTRMNLTKNIRQKSLFSSLSIMYKEDGITLVDKLSFKEPKTKKALDILEKLPVKNKRNILLVLNDEGQTVDRSFRNLENVTTSKAMDLNMLDVLKSSSLIFTLDSLESLSNRFNNGNRKSN